MPLGDLRVVQPLSRRAGDHRAKRGFTVMTLNLSNYEEKVTQAVRAFWGNRETAAQTQAQAGRRDQGERSGVTSGGNMDGFRDLALDIARDNGLTNASILFQRNVLNAPWLLSPYEQWDMLVLNNKEASRCIEFKNRMSAPLLLETTSTTERRKHLALLTTFGWHTVRAHSDKMPRGHFWDGSYWSRTRLVPGHR